VATSRLQHAAGNGGTLFEAQTAFRLALRQFLLFSDTNARSAGLTAQQHATLLAVYGAPGRGAVRVGELAARLHVRHNSAVGLVDALVSRGLIVREPSRTDRRVVLLRVTRRGLRVLRRVSAKNRKELRRVRPELMRFLRRLGRPL